MPVDSTLLVPPSAKQVRKWLHVQRSLHVQSGEAGSTAQPAAGNNPGGSYLFPRASQPAFGVHAVTNTSVTLP